MTPQLLKRLQAKLPNIYRFIPGKKKIITIVKTQKIYIFLGVLGFYATILAALCIVILQLEIIQHKQKQLVTKRTELLNDIIYWQQVVEKNDNYRDGFFMLATLEYQLGNMNMANMYLQKTLYIDPTDEAAIQFENMIEK